MSILSVDNISPIGSGATVSLNAIVGINTDASGNGSGGKLVVGGRVQSNAGGYWFAGANGAEDGWHVQDSSGNFVVVESGVAERLRIDSSGRVVIGTTAASTLTSTDDLTISTSGSTGITLFSGTGYAGNITFGDGTSGDDRQRGLLQYHHSDNTMRFFTNAVKRMTINSDGKVGLGTTGSDYALSIREADNNNKFLMLQKNSGQQLLQIREDGDNHVIIDGSHASGELHFYTAGSERLRIKSDGKVGIGTNNPNGFLDINSDSASAVTNMYLRNHANLGGAALNIWTQGNYGAPTYKAIIGCSDAGGNIRMGAHSNHDLLLLTNNTERLRINSSGHVTKPNNPSFRAGLTSNSTFNTNSYIVFNDTGATWHHNTGNHYNTSNGRFTAPVAGVYQFNACIIYGPFGGTNNVFMGDAFLFYVNGGNAGYSGRRGYYINGDSGNNYYTDHMSINLKLNATDYVQIRNGAPYTAIHGNTYYTWFAGTLLG